jgi:excisionase family DNA binding protein
MTLDEAQREFEQLNRRGFETMPASLRRQWDQLHQQEVKGYLSVNEAANLMGVSGKLVYAMYHRGELEGYRARGKVLVARHSVLCYIAAHTNKRPENVPSSVPLEKVYTPTAPKATAGRGGFRFLPPRSSHL